MLRLVVVSVSNPVIADIIDSKKNLKEKYGDILELKLFYVGRGTEGETLKRIENAILDSDFVILDLMGSEEDVGKTCFNACNSSSCNTVIIGNIGRNNLSSISRLGEFSVSEITSRANKPDKKLLADEMLNIAKEIELIDRDILSRKHKDIINYVNIGKYWKKCRR